MHSKSTKTISMLFVVVMMIGNGITSAKTTASTPIFDAPRVGVSDWNGDTSHAVEISIYDASDCEVGYKIFRAQDFSSTFTLVKTISSQTPANVYSYIPQFDSTVSYNTWYTYKVMVYKADDSLFSSACTTYTYRYIGALQQQGIKFLKVSDFAVSDSGSFSALCGDSIILKDKTSPAGKYSAINVKNSANPVFAGYIDSTALLTYPANTLIPIVMKQRILNSFGNTKIVKCRIGNSERAIVAKDSSIYMYDISNNNLVIKDSLKLDFAGNSDLKLLLLNDTLLMVQSSLFFNQWMFGAKSLISLRIIPLASSRFISSVVIDSLIIGADMASHSRTKQFEPLSFHGMSNGNMFITKDGVSVMGTNSGGIYTSNYKTGMITNLEKKVSASVKLNLPYANAYNTGCYMSQKEVVCTNVFPVLYGDNGWPLSSALEELVPGDIPTELFVAKIDDPSPHFTDSIHGLIYRDTIHLQNTLQNIIPDTANKRIFLIYTDNISILTYQEQTIGVITPKINLSEFNSKRLVVRNSTTSSGVTMILPQHSTPASLSIFTLSGRLVEQIPNITSNAILWKPKTRSVNCYIAKAMVDGKNYSEKFFVR